MKNEKKQKHVKQGTALDCKCKFCGKEYRYVYLGNRKTLKGHSKTCCNSCHANRRRFGLKDRLVSYFGGKCIVCGYSRCTAALDFHHLDPSIKDMSFAGNHARRFEVLLAEAKKCVLVCSNCHREIHAGLVNPLEDKKKE